MENPLKDIPKPVLIVMGGAAIGIGYVVVKNRGANAEEDGAPIVDDAIYPATPVADSYSGGTYQSVVPSGVAYVGGEGYRGEDASSTVGAVGQTALDSVLGLATAAIDALGRQAGAATETSHSTVQTALQQPTQPSPDLVTAIRTPPQTPVAAVAEPINPETAQILAALRQPPPQATIPMPQPPPPARPATPPQKPETLPAGYKKFPMGEVKYKKSFPGAIGWARIDSGGKGAKHWIDYHIRFPKGKIQRWRYTPASSASRWKLIWKN